MTGKASTRAKNKYNAANYERIALVVPKGKKDIIKAYAQSKGESLNSFVNKAIDNEMKNK
ncbi:antitoxin [uncultured Eubacterium sp.]|uniref:antitoxin n=1 Tax=uncultured Eubacterium sp. TaxID=165185 RepID=UPI002803A69B|nr:antitoxin [uncultured Eubacterium sp.]